MDGLSVPGSENIVRLASVIKCSTDWLLSGKEFEGVVLGKAHEKLISAYDNPHETGQELGLDVFNKYRKQYQEKAGNHEACHPQGATKG